MRADPTLVLAARGFLEHWLVRKDYDAAFAGLSPMAYAGAIKKLDDVACGR